MQSVGFPEILFISSQDTAWRDDMMTATSCAFKYSVWIIESLLGSEDFLASTGLEMFGL